MKFAAYSRSFFKILYCYILFILFLTCLNWQTEILTQCFLYINLFVETATNKLPSVCVRHVPCTSCICAWCPHTFYICLIYFLTRCNTFFKAVFKYAAVAYMLWSVTQLWNLSCDLYSKQPANCFLKTNRTSWVMLQPVHNVKVNVNNDK